MYKLILIAIFTFLLTFEAHSQSSTFYSYATVYSKTNVSGNLYNVTFRNFNGGLKPYPNANLWTINDIQVGQVFFLACYRFTISQVIQRTPNLILRVTDTTSTSILSSSDALGLRTVIGQETSINNKPVSLFFNIADANSGTQMGINSMSAACIYDFYSKNLQSVLNVGLETKICGEPSTIPTSLLNYVQIDTCNSLTYLFSKSDTTWYNQTNIVGSSTPQLESVNGIVKINNRKVYWFNTNTNEWYDPIADAWKNRREYIVDSLLYANNIWWGKNTFKDTVTLEKRMLAKDGIDSDGVITTKGLTSDSMITSVGVKSSGTSSKAASENNGVQKDAVIEVTVNTTLDGTYNTIVGVPSSSDIVLTLPVIAAENNGWKYTISKKNTSSYNVRVTASGFNHVIISPNSPVIIRNRGGTWQVE